MPNLPLTPEIAAVLAVVAAIGLYMMGVGARRVVRAARSRGASIETEQTLDLGQPLDTDADHPMPFGWSTAWLAVRTRDPLRLMDILGLTGQRRAGWRTGLATINDASTGDAAVFVSPAVDGWTFVVGYGLPHPSADPRTDCATPLLETLARHYGDVQYFFASPPLDLHAWGRYVQGKRLRMVAAAGSDILFSDGEPGDVERALGIGSGTDEAAPAPAAKSRAGKPLAWRPTVVTAETPQQRIPDEAAVFALAGAWGIDPTQLGSANDAVGPPALGFLADVPAAWRKRVADRAAG